MRHRVIPFQDGAGSGSRFRRFCALACLLAAFAFGLSASIHMADADSVTLAFDNAEAATGDGPAALECLAMPGCVTCVAMLTGASPAAAPDAVAAIDLRPAPAGHSPPPLSRPPIVSIDV